MMSARLRRAIGRLARRVGVGVLPLIAACDRCGSPPPPPPRATQPTLSVAPDPKAPDAGRRVVAVGQIAQAWHTGVWSPASITLSEVAQGDTIVVVGAYWGDLVARSSTAPTDDHGVLSRIVDQGGEIVGRKKPPVFAQLYVEFDPAPGAHTIVPPYLGGPAGDGTMYVVQLRGVHEKRVISGETWIAGGPFPGVAVKTNGVVDEESLVIALAGFDNTKPRDHAGWSHPPTDWTALGVNDDAANNVPSELCARTLDSAATSSVAWTWTDPTANVAVAVIAAFH